MRWIGFDVDALNDRDRSGEQWGKACRLALNRRRNRQTGKGPAEIKRGSMMMEAWRRSVIERTTERASEYGYSSHHFSRSVPMCALDLRAAESPPTG
jgi:hypothetical protein